MKKWRERLVKEPRALYGLMGAIILVWIYALIALHDHVNRLGEERRALRLQSIQLDRLGREGGWKSLAEAAEERLTNFNSRLWLAESEGRMQAEFQDWLRQLAAKQGLHMREMIVSQAEPVRDMAGAEGQQSSLLPEGWRILQARVSLEWEPQTFASWLASLAEAQRWLWIERLSLKNGRPATVELELAGLFAIGARIQ